MKENNNQNKFVYKIVSRIIDLIYSPEKSSERILIVLTLFGFILRLIASINLDVLADDMVYASQGAGIISSKIISTHSNPPLFFYLTDLSYKIFGYTTFASRFWPLIFGTLLIPLIFLITNNFFDKRVALGASFFVTFSNFLTRMTFTEQSLVALFFIFLGIYFGLEFIKYKDMGNLVYSSIGFGLGLLTKYNTPFFILSFIIFVAIYKKSNKEKILTKNNLKLLSIFVLILVLFSLPFLTFNFMIYKEKGIVDVYFSRIFKIDKTQEVYGGLAGQNNSFFDNLRKFSNYGNYNLLYKTDKLILIFGLIGLILISKSRERKFLLFLSILLLIPFILQSAGAPLQKHFAFIPLLFSIPAGFSLANISKKLNNKILFNLLILFICLLSIVNLGTAYGTPKSIFSKSSTSQLKTFINGLDDKDLLVFDNRIYTGQIFWLATDKDFLNFQQFMEFYNYNQKINDTDKENTNVFFIECTIGDCGWGNIKDNKEIREFADNFIKNIKNSSNVVKTIYDYQFEGNEILGKKNKIEVYKIHSVPLNISPNLKMQIKQIQNFYFTPYLYKNMKDYFFNFNSESSNNILNLLSLMIIYLSIILSVCLPFVILSRISR